MISFLASERTSSFGEAESPQKELYFWLRKMSLIGLGKVGDIHICCCPELAKAHSLALSHSVFCFVLN